MDSIESDDDSLPGHARQRERTTRILRKAAIAEFIGTFFLVSVIALAAGQSQPLAPLAIGTTLSVMNFAFKQVSGAHFNPAISFAVRLRGHIGTWQTFVYMVSQITGAFAGALLQRLVIHELDVGCVKHPETMCGYGYPKVNPDISSLYAVMTEALFTFALASVVLNVATTKKNENNFMSSFAIGMTVFAGAVAAGNISGGCFNPAVGTALPVTHGKFTSVWIYWIGPLAGASLASLVFRLTADDEDLEPID